MKFYEEASKKFAGKMKEQYKRDVRRTSSAQIKQNFETNYTFSNGVLLTTFRQNGEVIEGNTRNTIDTGALRDSIEMKWVGDTLKMTSDSPYFAYVMFGYVTLSGRIVPPRIKELSTIRLSKNHASKQ